MSAAAMTNSRKRKHDDMHPPEQAIEVKEQQTTMLHLPTEVLSKVVCLATQNNAASKHALRFVNRKFYDAAKSPYAFKSSSSIRLTYEGVRVDDELRKAIHQNVHILDNDGRKLYSIKPSKFGAFLRDVLPNKENHLVRVTTVRSRLAIEELVGGSAKKFLEPLNPKNHVRLEALHLDGCLEVGWYYDWLPSLLNIHKQTLTAVRIVQGKCHHRWDLAPDESWVHTLKGLPKLSSVDMDTSHWKRVSAPYEQRLNVMKTWIELIEQNARQWRHIRIHSIELWSGSANVVMQHFAKLIETIKSILTHHRMEKKPLKVELEMNIEAFRALMHDVDHQAVLDMMKDTLLIGAELEIEMTYPVPFDPDRQGYIPPLGPPPPGDTSDDDHSSDDTFEDDSSSVDTFADDHSSDATSEDDESFESPHVHDIITLHSDAIGPLNLDTDSRLNFEFNDSVLKFYNDMCEDHSEKPFAMKLILVDRPKDQRQTQLELYRLLNTSKRLAAGNSSKPVLLIGAFVQDVRQDFDEFVRTFNNVQAVSLHYMQSNQLALRLQLTLPVEGVSGKECLDVQNQRQVEIVLMPTKLTKFKPPFTSEDLDWFEQIHYTFIHE